MTFFQKIWLRMYKISVCLLLGEYCFNTYMLTPLFLRSLLDMPSISGVCYITYLLIICFVALGLLFFLRTYILQIKILVKSLFSKIVYWFSNHLF